MRVRLYTTRINGNGFDLRHRPGVPTIQSITHLQPEPHRGGVAEIYGISNGYLSCSIIAEIYSGYLPCSVLAGVYTGRSVTDRASRCRCALRYRPTFGHLPAMPQYSDISSTSAAGSTPYFASHYQGSYCL